eukprot:93208-Lingulodinium_polyedra.AAC.1
MAHAPGALVHIRRATMMDICHITASLFYRADGALVLVDCTLNSVAKLQPSSSTKYMVEANVWWTRVYSTLV